MRQQTILQADIVYYILGKYQLPDEVETLGICSRVCKTWLPIARSYLFDDMHLLIAQNTDGVIPQFKTSKRWVRWNGFLKPKYADLSLVKHLRITSGYSLVVITPPILSSALDFFPRMKHLHITWARMIFPEPCTETPATRPYLDTLELYHVYIPGDDFINLLSHFSRVRSLVLKDFHPRYPTMLFPNTLPQPPLSLQPLSLSILRCDQYHEPLLDFFGRSRAVDSLREFTFGFLDNFGPRHIGHPASIVQFIGRLKNIESLIWDEAPHVPCDMPFPSGDYAGLDSEINGFLDKLGPVFAEMRTLQKFSMRPPSSPSHWEIYLRLIHSLPKTLRHFEIYLTRDILFFDCEEFNNAMARFPELKSVSLIMMQWLAESPGKTEEYAESLYAELPELAARVRLEVVWQGHGCKFGPASDRDAPCELIDEPYDSDSSECMFDSGPI